ncbi:glutathione-regulated potassium-efflux system protein KefB [Pseudomonas sp. SWI6]|uniref:monovalent cation:proton antiporter-2 (CPA2) family protein n=2 Tax=Pseudomonas TaxID=286 RepID=UPI0009DC2FF9|nr:MULTISPECIES: monovalent cation:proton antiporter-2 (CPA2) family protein [Pseudomonas]MDT8922728.1 monovalent cation:proton antiporter-2 (CPA2) family protein [Pseudomonas taiwanensis]AVD81592.1 glutathione-regulated potassium-efflux system protein KefB [Pseudomonas sp. SWI6]AVD88543.1 glutathione-regulated potassium-efflux system protein KefB [Pseudomonas sp. SWI44]MPT01325.1 glutathione-regulated potassium-efflux system protein KefB [Pseudomonas sp.]WEZ87969.1 monovalent cation:proton an
MPHDGSLLQATVVFLLAVVLLVPLAQRLKLGAVPGYLLAGILIGPSMLGLINHPENVSRLSEMGVVMLLFVIGLELSPRRLWTMRRSLFGVGSLQVALTAVVLGLLAYLVFGQPRAAAIVLGLGLALSSTAFGLQVLAERRELGKPQGRLAVSILLFQDIAAIPLIAVVPLLGTGISPPEEGSWPLLAVALGVGLVIVTGRYLLQPVFRWTVGSGLHELSTATALLVVLGTAWVMEHVGVSMALGAFLAGVVMADSPFRHELESQVEPLKGLLLGLFFVGVGMTADLRLLLSMPVQVLGLTVLLVGVKLPLLFMLGRTAGGLERAQALCLAVVLASGGEFAFVVFKLALEHRVLEQQVHDLLVLAITLSMAVVPLVMMALARQLRDDATVAAAAAALPEVDETPQVVVAGLGRMGGAIVRMLHGEGVRLVALDTSIESVSRSSEPDGPLVFFGDPSRSEILRAARVDQAKLVIVATDDPQANLKAADVLAHLYPQTPVIAAARDSQEALRLLAMGVDPVRETFHSSLEMARRALIALGYSEEQASAWVQRYQRQEARRLLDQQHGKGDFPGAR